MPEASTAKALERAGRWEEALAAHNAELWRASRRGTIGELCSALLGAARTLRQSQRPDTAGEVADLLLEISRKIGDDRSVVRSLNLLGVLSHEAGDWRKAAGLYAEALECARNDGDDTMVATICPNLGAVQNALGEFFEARILYLEGIAACVRSGNAARAATSYNNLGMVCSDLGEWMEAEIHFLRGVEIAERVGDVALLTRLFTNRTEPLIRTGDLDKARLSLDRAEALAEEIGDRRAQADVERFRAAIAREEKDYVSAERHLTQALAIATNAKLDLERAEVLEETARLRWSQGRRGPARQLAREAERAYSSLGATRDLARITAIRGEWTPEGSDASDTGQGLVRSNQHS